MLLADQIRKFVLDQYIEPARRNGKKSIRIRVGDVHSAMGLSSHQPAVAGALGANKFESYAKVRLVSREGPHMGANLIFTFELL
jgi:5-methylcytosine-specific restriction protein B